MNEFFNKKEMANILKVSLNTLNSWICKKKIPFLKLGAGKNASVRFSWDEIESWLKNMKGEN